jgi:hypothetical protein
MGVQGYKPETVWMGCQLSHHRDGAESKIYQPHVLFQGYFNGYTLTFSSSFLDIALLQRHTPADMAPKPITICTVQWVRGKRAACTQR